MVKARRRFTIFTITHHHRGRAGELAHAKAQMIYGGAQAAPAKSVVRADRGGSGVRADMPGASVFAAPPEERGRLGGHCSSRRAAFCGVKKNVAFVALGTNGLTARLFRKYKVEVRNAEKNWFPVNGWSIDFRLVERKDL